MKTRVYDLAKELGVDSHSLVDVLHSLGHEIKSHMSAISDIAADDVREMRGAPRKSTPPLEERKRIEEEEQKKVEQEKAKKEAAKKRAAEKKAAAKEKADAKKAAAQKPAAKKPATKKKAAATKETVETPAVEKEAVVEAKPAPTPPPVEVAEEPETGTEPKTEPAPLQEEATTEPKPKPQLEKKEEPKPAKPKAPAAKSRIIGKIDLSEQVLQEANKQRGRRRGGKGNGDTESGSGTKKKRKKVFFTKSGQPLYHQRNRRATPQQRLVIPDELAVTLPVTVKDLSALIGVKAQAIIKKLMLSGQMVRMNDSLDEEMIHVIGMEFGKQIEVKQPKSVEELLVEKEIPDAPEDLVERPPVITLLGHVDHGKTSLLDHIRKTRVVDKESGGITQHIGAYQIKADDKRITFLDTPGHEAFTAMRARGANITDLVILVVAADDGVMPQTEEAINHARAAGVPIVVAVNKIDKSDADPMKTRQQLSTLDLAPEEWGGSTVFVEVSATTGQGVDELMEMLALEAELLELKANASRLAGGTVLEARMTGGLGAVATVLVRHGTLRKGDIILSGSVFGRVRALRDSAGKEIDEAPPSTPVAVVGFPQPPEAGEPFRVVADLQTAREITEQRADQVKAQARAPRTHVTLESLFSHIEQGKVKELQVILKADVKGSLEVLLGSLTDLSTEEVKVVIIHSGVGGINESDILLADASNAVVVGFHVVPDERARTLARQMGVDIRLYQVIYQVTDEIRSALEGLLEPEARENVIGHAEVRDIFRVSKSGTIAGCYVTDGRFERSAKVRLTRDGVIIYDGKLDSLRRFKDDVKEVKEAFECGMKIAGYDDIKVGDIIEGYVVELITRTLADSK